MNLNVDIPTITVSKEEGDKLVKLVRSRGQVFMKFQMPIPSSDEVKLDIYFKQDSTNMWSFIHSIKNYIFQFEDKVISALYFLPQTSGTNKDRATVQTMFNCIDRDEIYDLAELYKTDCVGKLNFSKGCLENLISFLNPRAKEYYQKCFSRQERNIPSIEKKMAEAGQSGTHIMINGMTYHGTIKPEFVFEAICGAFNVSPKSCLFLNNNYSVFLNYSEYKQNSNKFKFFMKWINLTVLVILIIVAGLAIFFVYEKMYNRYLGENIQKIVRDSITNYESIKNNE